MTKKGKLLAFVNYNGLPLMTLGDKCLLSEIKPWGLGAVKGRHKDPLSEGGWQRALSGLNQHFLESPKPMSLCIDIKTGSFFFLGFPGHSVGKESTCNAGDTDSIPGSGRSPGVGNGNPLQYSCLENSMERGAWRASVLRGRKEPVTTEQAFRYFLFSTSTPFLN